MPSVAFLRNLNQGQRGSPSSAHLVEAFELAGAQGVATFQSNGTVLFDAPDPDVCAASAVDHLAVTSPWSDAAFVRSTEWLVALVAGVGSDETAFRRSELSLFDESLSPLGSLPIAGKRCTVVSGGPGFALTENERDNESNATPTLERALGTAVTSRGLPTLSRLVEWLAR
ncbi:MAG: DUF1697 domain-containing protein [Leifsonia sp.]